MTYWEEEKRDRKKKTSKVADKVRRRNSGYFRWGNSRQHHLARFLPLLGQVPLDVHRRRWNERLRRAEEEEGYIPEVRK